MSVARFHKSGDKLRTASATYLLSLILLASAADLGARSEVAPPGRLRASGAATPDYCMAAHDVGRIGLGISNYGVLGTGLALTNPRDCFK